MIGYLLCAIGFSAIIGGNLACISVYGVQNERADRQYVIGFCVRIVGVALTASGIILICVGM